MEIVLNNQLEADLNHGELCLTLTAERMNHDLKESNANSGMRVYILKTQASGEFLADRYRIVMEDKWSRSRCTEYADIESTYACLMAISNAMLAFTL